MLKLGEERSDKPLHEVQPCTGTFYDDLDLERCMEGT